ncbi:MAG: methyltransferase domain-containing protein [Thermoanaerobaculia bacterium]|nr:methyltransferase domain-containing protein [Thermoanaerobaculia bacterium]
MSGPTTVSVLLPPGGASSPGEARAAITGFLETTGLEFEIVALDATLEYGAALRRGVSDARGRVIVVVDPELPYPVSAIGDVVAMIESGATDVVFGTGGTRRSSLVRWLLVPTLPDPGLRFAGFSSTAGKRVVSETKLDGVECALEIGFLVNKYGFRIETLTVDVPAHDATLNFFAQVAAAVRIRLTNRNMGYRAARRCPVCFSQEVWTCGQVTGNVIRSCRRCKCRYLHQFSDEDDTHPVRRVMRPAATQGDSTEDAHSDSARSKTSVRRVAILRRQLTARARLLEVGVRDGSFASAASRDYEYVGIDPVQTLARQARGRGFEVYCATLANFVNTGPAFDGIALFHVFENMPDPHDALARMKDLLKPGGLLLLTTFDTEGLLYLLTERKRMAQNFRTHLILYSRSALIELLENSGFEIDAIVPDFEYRDRKFLRHVVSSRWPAVAPIARMLLEILPEPLLVGTGSIRILAKRRAGPPANVRAIRSVEPTHAR